ATFAQPGRDRPIRSCRSRALGGRDQGPKPLTGLAVSSEVGAGSPQESASNKERQEMVRESEIRDGELTVDMPPARDAGLVFIGRIRTPWKSRLETPRQGRHDGPVCRLEIFEPWVPAIKGVDFYESLEVIYWLHHTRGALVLQGPKKTQTPRGTFSLASPVRPNPIGTSIVKLVRIEGNVILV